METRSGLEGIIVAETRLSDVDGDAGRLVLCGHTVEELAPTATFEEACALFLDVDVATVKLQLGRGRVAAASQFGSDASPAESGRRDGMETLRAAIAQPPARGRGDNGEDALASIALFPVALASWWRGERVTADASAGHARDMLRMVRGVEPSDAEVRALDTYLVTVVDHGMNASTFAARVVASTGSDLRSALTAGVGALKGPLHGGAPGPVLDMLDAVERRSEASVEARARAFVESELDQGRRIMGMGHRIYRVRDPRAFVLERAIEKLAPTARLAVARAVEREAERALSTRHPERALKANVEFFTAVLLEAVGIDRALFSSVFACSRVVGWCAHVREQRQTGRLIRPSSRYVR